MTRKEQIFKLSKSICRDISHSCEECILYRNDNDNSCGIVEYMGILFDEGYRISAENNKILHTPSNNIEENCIAFVADTLLNRPKDIEERVVKYNEEDKAILIKQIEEQMAILEEHRLIISSSCYRGLIGIYEGLYFLLKMNKI